MKCRSHFRRRFKSLNLSFLDHFRFLLIRFRLCIQSSSIDRFHVQADLQSVLLLPAPVPADRRGGAAGCEGAVRGVLAARRDERGRSAAVPGGGSGGAERHGGGGAGHHRFAKASPHIPPKGAQFGGVLQVSLQ